MSVAIVDYGSGNLRSAEKALLRAARELGRDDAVIVTADAARVAKAERVVLPGVGAFADCMDGLSRLSGMREALEEAVLKQGTPFLGICVGMQLLARTGYEFGAHAGLGWVGGEVRAIAPADPSLKVPHMGWNTLHMVEPHPLFAGIGEGADVYFVHSFGMTGDVSAVIATTDYGGPITAAVARGNIAGVQFHPEKSQATGLRILANFLTWAP